MSFIEMKDIVKVYGKLTILHKVNMSLEKGEVISIIGPSGAGKSTLLRCLNHLETIQEDPFCRRRLSRGRKEWRSHLRQ